VIPDIRHLRTPCYVMDMGLLKRNLETLHHVVTQTHCTMLLALKGFAAWSTFPLCRQYLAGVTASSLHEAMLGKHEFGKEVHAYAPAYRDDEIDAYLDCVDHIVFNSFAQWNRFKPRIQASAKPISCGLRVNPQYSEIEVELYNPCAPKSRLGITIDQFENQDLDGIDGLHFHTLCEQNSDTLERTLAVLDQKFGAYLQGMKWLNFGGGHHITRADYDIDRLCRLINQCKQQYNLQVILEPGEAVGLNTGYLVTSVLDIVHNAMDLAILDTSAAAHMPDVLEMPYRPRLENAGEANEYPHTYRLGGLTCLAGDVIGDYSFQQPLHSGDKLVFHDMAHYTMVKNNTFNGVRLPDIVLYDPDTRQCTVVKEFSYTDYKSRLS
jgi:carboxynorspermidine decarboxylase